jgi:ribosomal-protein-alanine N-acetyltransferase
VIVRAASEADLLIQASAPEASQWDPRDYLGYQCRVAERGSSVVGFVVTRVVAEREQEILNLAVAPDARRQGIGRQLLSDILERNPGDFFLEVRESNRSARQFYERFGFKVVTVRLQYYSNPPDSAIVMKLHSW